MLKLKKTYEFEKIGLNEVIGLKVAMEEVLQPIVNHLERSIHWIDDLKFSETEYRSRDGFIPYESNCGGMELCEIIPKCEEYNFSFLEFGECDECNGETQCGYEGMECAGDSEGHNDAKLRVWLKFEGIENGIMSFYLVLSGGNGDAPYFREKSSTTYFESEFKACSLEAFKRIATGHVAELLKVMK